MKSGTFGLDCDITGRRKFFVADPMSIDLNAPPVSVTIYGENISTTYGLPTVEYYDENGTLVAYEQASEVAPDGSWLRGPAPDLSSVYTGVYTLMVRAPMADGSMDLFGGATVDVYGRDEPQQQCCDQFGTCTC